MEANQVAPPQKYQSIFLWGVVFLFFFQLLTEFVEGIYLYGLLGTDIPPEIGLVIFFFAPLLLIFARKNPHGTLIRILASVGFVARCIEIALPTRGRMIVSGIGLVALLIYLPAVFSLNRRSQERGEFSRQVGMGLSLAVFAHVLLRALHSGSDLSAYGGYRVISWGLAVAALVVLWSSRQSEGASSQVEGAARKSKVVFYSLGLFGVVAILYYAIVAPNVVARWAGVSGLSVFVVLLLSWGVGGWLWLTQKKLSKNTLLVLGVLFGLAMVMAIFPHQVNFPAEEGGYPLSEPEISVVQQIPLYLMLVLSPVLLSIFVRYLDGILAEQPKIRLLGGGFGLGGGFLLLMVLSHVFTTVYDYIPVIGPFFRDKYWLVYLLAGLVAVLPLALSYRAEEEKPTVLTSVRRTWLVAAGGMTIVAIIGMVLLTASPTPPGSERSGLRVFTYNIQQGYDALGERNFDGQIDLIQSTAPDILGLQESDTARIAGGNTDVVGYFANQLDMYAYYGPTPVTGTFGIALLSKYPIENPHTYYLYSEGEQVAVIEADITVSGKTFKVYVSHLGNGGPIFQMRQMLELMRGQENVIAIGDFNFRPYEEQYAITVAEYDDAYTQAVSYEASNILGGSGEFDIDERIDHVFVSPGMPVLYVKYFTDDESDHPGLFAEIGIGN